MVAHSAPLLVGTQAVAALAAAEKGLYVSYAHARSTTGE